MRGSKVQCKSYNWYCVELHDDTCEECYRILDQRDARVTRFCHPMIDRGGRHRLATWTIAWCIITKQALARNPAIMHRYSADPSAHVWPLSDELWVYASHDQDDAEDMETMSEYFVYSTHDMVRSH